MVFLGLLLASIKRPSVGFGTILLFYLAPLSHLTSGLLATLPFDVRLLSVPFLFPFVTRQSAGLAPARVAMAVWAVPLIAGTSVLWSIDRNASLESAVGLLLGGVTAVFVARALPYAQVTALARRFCLAIVVLSVLFVPFSAEAVLGGRVRGVMGNPNALAAVIVLLVPLLAMRYGWRSPVTWLVLGVLPFTGSRAATAAVLLEAAVSIWVGADRRVRRTLLPALLVAVAILAFFELNAAIFVSTDPTSVLRSADSRTSLWANGLRLAGDAPWSGYGLGASPADVANSYLLGVVELGSLSVLLFGAALAVIVHALRPQRVEIAALAAGGLCNATFESWLLAGGSLLFVVFWTVMAAAGVVERCRGKQV